MGSSVSLEKDVKQLESSVGTLRAKRADLLERVETEEETGHLRRLQTVEDWLTRSDTTLRKADDLLLRNGVSLKKIAKINKEVDKLKSEGVFKAVTRRVPPPKVLWVPTEPMVGREDMLQTAWKLLMEDGVSVIGLYGTGGVGKTAILRHINMKMLREDPDQFDIAIWVCVSKDDPNLSIQRCIGERLGLDKFNDKWNQWETYRKASRIYDALSKKRFVLFLDGLVTEVDMDLSELGIPTPTKRNGCKVVFSTRSKELCSLMEPDVKAEVKCLSPDDAWDLFQKNVTVKTLSMHPEITELAKEIARKCRGLPLALKVIGGKMASKSSVYDWKHAVNMWTPSTIEKMCFEAHGREVEIFSQEL